MMSFDPSINLGNVLTAGGMVVGAVAAFFTMKTMIVRLEERMTSYGALIQQQFTSAAQLLDTKLEGIKENVGLRHDENRKAFENLQRTVDDSKRSSDTVAMKVGSVADRVLVLEQKITVQH